MDEEEVHDRISNTWVVDDSPVSRDIHSEASWRTYQVGDFRIVLKLFDWDKEAEGAVPTIVRFVFVAILEGFTTL